MNDSLKWGARVRLGGRTMLRPGFSLVGLEGIVVHSAPNTPPGCMTVAVDWQAGGYTEENGYDTEGFPLFVNVPQEHLEVVTEEEVEAAKTESRPTLSIVKDDEPQPAGEPSPAEPPSAPPELVATPVAQDSLSEEEPVPDEPPVTEERPRLRLI